MRQGATGEVGAYYFPTITSETPPVPSSGLSGDMHSYYGSYGPNQFFPPNASVGISRTKSRAVP